VGVQEVRWDKGGIELVFFVSTLGQMNPVYAFPSHSFTLILTLSAHLLLGLPNGLFPSGFPTTTL
jgi:hypothetical protein